ncbi:MAG: 1-acyl-sn-glycerol-3-phosphate acyltransferase [Nitrospirae bacterium]|nr:1-acyl-sn-glycerol-3-phosphate acyltransferase [Nitrospirota bacterium]
MKRYWLLIRLFLFLLSGGARTMARLAVLTRIDKDRAGHFLLTRAGEWSRRAMAKAGARVRVEGLEKIPERGAVLYVANHQGALDIPILMGHLPGSPAFVAKKELFRIPVLGYWMRRVGCVELDRENARAARQAILEAADRLRGGRRLVLFPEGTRSRDPEGRMAAFKRGSLKLATAADAVLVPVTVEGSRFLLRERVPVGFDGEVRVIVGDPIDVSVLDEAERKALPQRVHATIESTLARHHMGIGAGGPVAP